MGGWNEQSLDLQGQYIQVGSIETVNCIKASKQKINNNLEALLKMRTENESDTNADVCLSGKYFAL